jgi:L-cysteine:1D-myo-inositol 2-amino-2-deoxy-alpha-D-glucopyranoside ligase
LKLYNTLTKRLEEFKSANDPARIYVCGVTPYDTTHLGHAFTYVFFDTLIRYLRWQGYRVRYVRNITDIDDDILRRASELNISYQELAQQCFMEFKANMAQLHALSPKVEPRATEEIPGIIEVVDSLLVQGAAYQRDGNVYFRVRAAPEYGRLSALERRNMLELARQMGGNPDDPDKEDPLDFLLWQSSGPSEPSWESPWGPGRPGWHIECTAMAIRHLGERLDIHGGGSDLIFPHHESETAQSERFTGESPFARLWVHTGMVKLNGESMSKSLGNMVFVTELLRQYSPDALRFTLLSHHYRQDWEYREQELLESRDAIERIARALSVSSAGQGTPILGVEDYCHQFRSAMDDDMNLPLALEVITSLADRVLDGVFHGLNVYDAQRGLARLCEVLGLQVYSGSR